MTFDPASLLDVSHAATFLGGTAVGAAGKYVADLFTDQRHKKEAKASERQGYLNLKKVMPDLLAEIKEDLFRNQSLHLREFVILPNPNVTFNHDRARMEFFESKHPSVRNQVVTLLGGGYIESVKEGQCPIYRLKEHFVQLLTHDA